MPRQAAPPATGRASIFRNKEGGTRVQGLITPKGGIRFEAARKRLAKLADKEVEQISDADVVEFLARGESETVRYLAGETN